MIPVLLLVASCGVKEPVEPTVPEPAPLDEPAPAEEASPEACVEACQQASGMRAVPWEVVVADCQRECGLEPTDPGATSDLP